MVTEWIISGNPTKYDVINAFRELGTIDWRQSINVQVKKILVYMNLIIEPVAQNIGIIPI